MKHFVKLLLVTQMLLAAVAVTANPLPYNMCQWDYGETDLGLMGPGEAPLIVLPGDSPMPAYSGDGSLRLIVAEQPGSIDPTEIVLLINLEAGSGRPVNAGFSGYGEFPNARISVHAYAANAMPSSMADLGPYLGGSEPSMPSPWWEEHRHEWEIPDGWTGIIVTARIDGYINDEVWIDNLFLEWGHGSIMISPCGQLVPNETTTFGKLKALYK